MKRLMTLLMVSLLVAAGGFVTGEEQDDKTAKREKIDAMAGEALETLFAKSPDARKLYDQAYGYAVFGNLKIALGVSGGGGSGVAVARAGDERTYMKMGTGGVGLAVGAQKYQLVFLIEDEKTFNHFVNEGWQADTQANAAAGTKGAGAASSFKSGLSIYHLTEKGLMASADITGTRYWKNDKLNNE